MSGPAASQLPRIVARAAALRVPPPQTTAYRLVNAEGDGLPGVTADWFDGVVVLALYREATGAEEAALAEALIAAGARSVYLKRRPKHSGRVARAQGDEVAPESPLRGVAVSELEIREGGLRFLIRPGQGLSVGLYLDAREVRAWVRQHARGRTVLNCFSYTCGFGVAALAGGAARAINVDASRRVLDWGEANARLNGFAPARADFIAGDAFDQLARFAKRNEKFDLVVIDPPSFATTKKSRFSAAIDYPRLAAAAAKGVSPGGLLVACCNLAALSRQRFESLVFAGLSQAGLGGKVIERLGPPPMDFPPAPGTGPDLKVAVVQLSP